MTRARLALSALLVLGLLGWLYRTFQPMSMVKHVVAAAEG